MRQSARRRYLRGAALVVCLLSVGAVGAAAVIWNAATVAGNRRNDPGASMNPWNPPESGRSGARPTPPRPSESRPPSPTPSRSTTPAEPAPTATAVAKERADTPIWGLAGGYEGIDAADPYRRGIRAVLVEIAWSSAEKSEGSIDARYLQQAADTIRSWHAKGYHVVLNYGLHHAPGWLLAKPGARFVNQFGQTYTASDQANLIWNVGLRTYAERYTASVFAALRANGAEVYAVRVGGGLHGELHYPFRPDGAGNLPNHYWAFDPSASARNPVPGWKPGDPSPNGAARTFLNWYLNRLSEFQNWQITTVRRFAPNPYIAVLYASHGMRPGDFDKAVATGLNGTSSAERNGEVQRGYDFARHIRSITDPRAAVWGTWAENTGVLGYLAGLADAEGLAKMGENSGHDDVTRMSNTVTAARRYRLSLLMWIRASEAYCRCDGYATIDDYERLTQN